LTPAESDVIIFLEIKKLNIIQKLEIAPIAPGLFVSIYIDERREKWV
jgi:hypothetical protein